MHGEAKLTGAQNVAANGGGSAISYRYNILMHHLKPFSGLCIMKQKIIQPIC
jgi:hypothetical protein